jgi:ATP-dependent RNA helicase RhlE
MTTFSDLGLNAQLLKSLATEGYSSPTPIQAQAIPGVLSGRDLLGVAQTGTGKTAAFALPILQRLMDDRRPPMRGGTRVLILSPTRELAAQIAESFRTYGRHTGLTVAVMFGGVPPRPQAAAMRNGVDILVATPGRLIDHMMQRAVILSGTEILVLDEADQMLDMGFIRPIRQILSKIPAKRQCLFFSATMPREIGQLADEILHDPVRVSVTPAAKTADRVAQKVIHVEPRMKSALLASLLDDPAMGRTLVFTRTKRGADKVARYLTEAGIHIAAIHGNKSQGQRERALSEFKSGRIRGLVATDIAARGIDVDGVTHVINYDLPVTPESYVHRIGRTGRAGAEGIAISLCGSEERGLLRDIERLTRQSIPSTQHSGGAGSAGPRPAQGQAQGQAHGQAPGGRAHGQAPGRAPAPASAPGSHRAHGRNFQGRNNGSGRPGGPFKGHRQASGSRPRAGQA